MKTLKVSLGERTYNILITSDNLPALAAGLKQAYSGKKILAVTNETIFNLHGSYLKQLLQEYEYSIVTVPDSEDAKSLAELDKLYTAAISAGLDRHSAVLAFGGGVVGDVAGFMAATLYRGIDFIQVPTTLLAQVDSSVGGKVAVNHPLGKNLIGAFHQPKIVLIDTNLLSTLPGREFKSGLAEVLKYAFIWDKQFYDYLLENVAKITSHNVEALAHIIQVSCTIKSEIVSKDEKEESLRAILNFGHTVGHALENIIGYGVIKHGEAVSIGMVQAFKLALNMGKLNIEDYQRMYNLIEAYGLAAVVPEGISTEKIVAACMTDKKAENRTLTFILTPRLGEAIIEKGLTPEKILRLLV